MAPSLLLVGEDLDAGGEELVELRSEELGAVLGEVDERFERCVVFPLFNALHGDRQDG